MTYQKQKITPIFLELITDVKTTSINTRQLKILTGLNFFQSVW